MGPLECVGIDQIGWERKTDTALHDLRSHEVKAILSKDKWHSWPGVQHRQRYMYVDACRSDHHLNSMREQCYHTESIHFESNQSTLPI